VLFHLESQTDGRMKHDDANKRLFMKKWSDALLGDEDAYYLVDGYKLTHRVSRGVRIPKLTRIRSRAEWEAWDLVAEVQRLAAEEDRRGIARVLEQFVQWPDEPGALRFGGAAAKWVRRMDLAVSLFSRALPLDDDPNLRASYIHALLAEKRTDLAEHELDALEEKAERYPGAWMLRGVLCLGRNDFTGAGDAFEKAMFFGSEPREALYGAMIAAARRGDDNALWQAGRGVLGLDPGNRDAMEHVLRLEKGPERAEELRQYLAEYLAIQPGDRAARREYEKLA
jgi:tetratricopeptide (TPR) repeat protein